MWMVTGQPGLVHWGRVLQCRIYWKYQTQNQGSRDRPTLSALAFAPNCHDPWQRGFRKSSNPGCRGFPGAGRRAPAAAVSIERAAALVRTPHPTLMGLTFIWTRSSGVVVDTAPEEARTHSRFLTSPIYRVFEEGITIRRRLQDGEGTDEYPFLGEFQNRGATDYLAYPITFIGGEHHVLTWTCFTLAGSMTGISRCCCPSSAHSHAPRRSSRSNERRKAC